ncbi:Lipoprotein YhcN precursor [Pelotomaculum sp. FP]|uniref:YhcN/YlaJ family sporulation lipoprotein n=1 Tax=Pelotomaculum sp. FP TaxID=261474 RepID=UPI001066CF33|nr:YhcN/YlaJ family sporulation lipoprotein [Pelotomaculum sp. FP]TEB13581.1 Lipoprotein YhcN precursor [Pelotomaculum sp. FP]
MKKPEKFVAWVAAVVFGAALLAGCNAVRKPEPQNPPTQQQPTAPAAPSQQPMPTDAGELNNIANKISSAAMKVRGVNTATTVIAGSIAYVGVDQKAGTEQRETDRIKSEVSDEAKKAEPRLTTVYVSSDADTVTRIRRVAEGIAAGQPISAFDSELAEIVKRMSPTSK